MQLIVELLILPDDKLAKRIYRKCLKIADEQDSVQRQIYKYNVNKLSYGLHFNNLHKDKGKVKKKLRAAMRRRKEAVS
jgi:hypothetical protein